MQELIAEPFVRAVSALSEISSLVETYVEQNPQAGSGVLEKKGRSELRRHLRAIKQSASVIGAENTVNEVRHFERRLRQDKFNWSEAQMLIQGLQRLLLSEISNTKVFALGMSEAKFYGQAAEVFGIEPVLVFPKSEFDLEEAGKCLAVARNTASVFHLMRAMESVLQTLCTQLGLEKVDKRWGYLLSDIDGKLELMPNGETKSKWSVARSNLWHVKEAWRNDTMHPNQKYTTEEATEVLQSVKAFIKSLAELPSVAKPSA